MRRPYQKLLSFSLHRNVGMDICDELKIINC